MISGPIKPTSIRGYSYFIIFVDDCSRNCTVFLLKQKSEAYHAFSVFAKQVENRFGRPITFFHTDNEVVLQSKQFNAYFVQYGITPMYSCRYSPNQNGIAERMMLTLLNSVRSMLQESSLSKPYWCYALLYAAVTRNISPTSSNSLVPFEMWIQRPPSYEHLAVFGQHCIVSVPLVDRQRTGTTKLARGVKGLFLGFAPNKKGYLIETESGKLIDCQYQDVKFISTAPALQSIGAAPSPTSVVDLSVPDSTPLPTVAVPSLQSDQSLSDELSSDLEFHAAETNSFSDEHLQSVIGNQLVEEPESSVSDTSLSDSFTEQQTTSDRVHTGSGIWKKWKYSSDPPKKDFKTVSILTGKRPRKAINYSTSLVAQRSVAFSAVVQRLHAASSSIESIVALSNHGRHQWYRSKSFSATLPHSYTDIANSDTPDEWYKAADEEISQLIRLGTWKLVPPPAGANVMKNTWVFRLKEKDGVIVRYKARLCACGYSQLEGIDYKELFSPTVHATSLRLHLALIAQRGMVTKQMDVTCAFLEGVTEETLHMKQPPGYIDPEHPDWVCRLLRNLYGLKQAPRVWHKTVDPFIQSLNFTPTSGDPCLYYRWDEAQLSLISLHVDDFTISSDCPSILDSIGKALSKQFTMTDDGELKNVLGLSIERDLSKSLVYISQKSYIKSLLKKFAMDEARPVKTPMETLTVSAADCPLSGSDEELEMAKVPYREACGALMSLAINSRPDILFAVGVGCRYMHNPGRAHWSLLKRILKYLVGTIDLRLCLGGASFSSGLVTSASLCNVQGKVPFFGLYDSDWAGDKDKARSTSGYCFYWFNSLLSWSSKLQGTISSSSTMAEYVSAYHTTAEALWIRETLLSIGLFPPGMTISLFGDNTAARALSKDHLVNQRSKHIATKYHLVRRKCEQGVIELVDIPSTENTSDIFTKPLGSTLFLKHRLALGLC